MGHVNRVRGRIGGCKDDHCPENHVKRVNASDGSEVYVDTSDRERGSEGPFMTAYTAADGRQRWGYFCANCESMDTAMDPMGRIVCNRCPNRRKPTEWDAAHE